MGEIVVSGLVEGGKATAGPPFGPALGPLGVNIGAIIAEINKRTEAYAGVKVPVKVIVDSVAKTYRIDIGSLPTSALILKELGVQAGAKTKEETVGNLTLDQVRKIVEAKGNSLYGKTVEARMKQVLGTCKSMGVKCDNEDPKIIIQKIDKGEIKL